MLIYAVGAIRIIILLVLAFIYAMFDVFNKRNVPNSFVYLTVALGVIATLLYYPDISVIGISALVAIIIGSLGYILYRKGILGGGDIFEFIVISLFIPIQTNPILNSMPQFNMPFILSVFISTGYVSFISIMLYYLVFVRNPEMEKRIKEGREPALISTALLIMYALLIYAMVIINGFSSSAVFLIALVAVPSSVILAYEKVINARMVAMIPPNKLEEGDMIAMNMMDSKEIRYFSKASKHFGRLATSEMIKDLKHEKKELTVYRNAPPLALFTFAGVLLSLLFGNVLLYFIL